MKNFSGATAFNGLQRRLLVLLIVALLPVFGYFIWSSYARQRESVMQATLGVQAVSHLSALAVGRTVEGARQLLNAITSVPSVRQSELQALCLEFLATIAKDYPYYTYLGVVDLDGNVTCDASGKRAGGNIADRTYFKRTLATRSFATGDYEIGRTSGKSSITFAMPILDNSGLLKGAALVALDLNHLDSGLKAPIQMGMRVSVTDRHGTILATDGLHSGAVGTRFADPALYSAMRSLPGEAFEAPDAGGQMRIYSVAAVKDNTENAIFVVASIDRAVVTAPAERRALIGFFLISLLTISGLLVAGWIGNRTLVAPARRLLRDIHALAGDGNEGVQLPAKNVDEMAALTSAFHRVAALLKAREAERDHDHAELQDAQNLLDMATRVSQLGAWRVNLNQQESRFELSDLACVIQGLPPGSTLAVDDAINFYVPAAAEVIRTLFQKCANEGAPFDTELQMVNAAGTKKWVRSIGQAVRSAEGTIVRVEGAIQDISARMLAEEDAAALESQLATTLGSISDGFFTISRDWRFTYINSQAEKLLRRSRADVQGQLIRDVLPVVEGTSFEQNITRAVREKHAVHFEDFYPPLGLWLELNVNPSETGFAVYFRDVSDQRAAKDQLRLLQTAVSRLNDIVLITETDPINGQGPRIVFVNDAFERRTGYLRSEVIGRSPKFLQGPGTSRGELDRIWVALEKREPVRAELLNYTKTGKAFWIELDIVPIADEKGCFTHWVAVTRDITERKRTEQEILELNVELEDRVHLRTAQLETANRELEAFSYSVSHDLRSPLNTINGFAQLLQKSGEENLNDKGKHYLNRIRAGALQMGELIDGLLLLAKMTRDPLQRQLVDLSALAHKVESQCREKEPERKVQVSIQSGMLVNGDATLLLVVMQNLFENAWKYTKKQAAARIEVGSEVGAAFETIYFVKDNGAGFDMAYVNKLFGVFQRLHSPSEFAGTGVGLANVKRVIERHGGRVWAQGIVNEGASFYFTLSGETSEVSQTAGTGPTGAKKHEVGNPLHLMRQSVWPTCTATGS